MSLTHLLKIDREHGMQEDTLTAERSYVLNSVKYLDLKYVAGVSPSDGVIIFVFKTLLALYSLKFFDLQFIQYNLRNQCNAVQFIHRHMSG